MEYLVVDKPRPIVLFEIAKGIVTGSTPDVGEQRRAHGARAADAGGQRGALIIAQVLVPGGAH